MTIENICIDKQKELIEKYFGNIEREAAIVRPETIGEYTKDLPLKIEAEYRDFLEGLWPDQAPEELKDRPPVLEERKLRELITDDDRELIDAAYKDATTITLRERIARSNHRDVAYYKGLLREYADELLTVMRLDFLEEITGKHIRNKSFETD